MYDKETLAKSSGVSLGVVAVVGLLFLSTGTAFAVPVAGIGGFVIEADSIEGDDLLLYPGVSETSEAGDYPQVVIEMRETEIEGLVLTKEIDLDGYDGVPLDGTAEVTIETDENVTSDQIFLRSPALEAQEATFSGFELSEQGSDDLNEAFSIRAPTNETPDTRQIDLDGGENPGLVMDDARIQATYLATNQITLGGLSLDVSYDDGDDQNDTQQQAFFESDADDDGDDRHGHTDGASDTKTATEKKHGH